MAVSMQGAPHFSSYPPRRFVLEYEYNTMFGEVTDVTDDGRLRLETLDGIFIYPDSWTIWSKLNFINKNLYTQKDIEVSLAGLVLTPEATAWLRKHILKTNVRLTALCCQGDHLQCEVFKSRKDDLQCEVFKSRKDDLQCEVFKRRVDDLQCEVFKSRGKDHLQCEVFKSRGEEDLQCEVFKRRGDDVYKWFMNNRSKMSDINEELVNLGLCRVVSESSSNLDESPNTVTSDFNHKHVDKLKQAGLLEEPDTVTNDGYHELIDRLKKIEEVNNSPKKDKD